MAILASERAEVLYKVRTMYRELAKKDFGKFEMRKDGVMESDAIVGMYMRNFRANSDGFQKAIREFERYLKWAATGWVNWEKANRANYVGTIISPKSIERYMSQ